MKSRGLPGFSGVYFLVFCKEYGSRISEMIYDDSGLFNDGINPDSIDYKVMGVADRLLPYYFNEHEFPGLSTEKFKKYIADYDEIVENNADNMIINKRTKNPKRLKIDVMLNLVQSYPAEYYITKRWKEDFRKYEHGHNLNESVKNEKRFYKGLFDIIDPIDEASQPFMKTYFNMMCGQFGYEMSELSKDNHEMLLNRLEPESNSARKLRKTLGIRKGPFSRKRVVNNPSGKIHFF